MACAKNVLSEHDAVSEMYVGPSKPVLYELDAVWQGAKHFAESPECKPRIVPKLVQPKVEPIPRRPRIEPSPCDPNQRKFLSLESMKRGIASMNAGDEALRNATVHMQKAQKFCILAAPPSE